MSHHILWSRFCLCVMQNLLQYPFASFLPIICVQLIPVVIRERECQALFKALQSTLCILEHLVLSLQQPWGVEQGVFTLFDSHMHKFQIS